MSLTKGDNHWLLHFFHKKCNILTLRKNSIIIIILYHFHCIIIKIITSWQTVRLRDVFRSQVTSILWNTCSFSRSKACQIDGRTDWRTETRTDRRTGNGQCNSYVAICFAGASIRVWELENQINFSLKYSVNLLINAALEQPKHPKKCIRIGLLFAWNPFSAGGGGGGGFAPLAPLPGLCPGPTGA